MAEMNCGMNMRNQGMQPWGAGCDRRPGQTGMPQPGFGMGQRPGMSCPVTGNRSREALKKQIDEASLAVDDASLFLDTHPGNPEAMRYFLNALALRKNAMDAYQSQYGPLFIDNVTGDSWNWVTEKWPWEGGY